MDNKSENPERPSLAFIELTSDLFVGRGLHKECYRYPGRPNLCIKIAYNEEGIDDLVSEARYREVISKKNLDYSVLPDYYGTVKTNKGTGYVYEFVIDYDGNISITVEDILKDAARFEQHFDCLIELLKQLRQDFFDKWIITKGLFPENIILQRTAPNKFRCRIINDMGTSTFIPLVYYFDYFARTHVERCWLRFTQHLEDFHHNGNFPSPLVLELSRQIK